DTKLAEKKAVEGDDITQLRASVETQNTSIATLNRELGELKLARDGARTENQNLQTQLNTQQAQHLELQKQITALERERDQLRVQINPAARRSMAFDNILGVIERGGGAQAQQVHAQALSDNVFERPARANSDLLTELVAAAAELEAF